MGSKRKRDQETEQDTAKQLETPPTKKHKKEKREKKKEEKKPKRKSSVSNEEPAKVPSASSTPKKSKKKETPASKPSSGVSTGAFREANKIAVDLDKNNDIEPTQTFDAVTERFPHTQPLIQAFCSTFKAPTPIQAQCWPIAFEGRDVVGIAETGSGKTMGFLIPGIVKLQQLGIKITNAKKGKNQPFILVLDPTRELAVQGDTSCNEASDKTGIKSVCIAGGFDRGAQTSAIKSGAQVVFATPGRLISLIEAREIDLSQVHYLVLDEADRMLDMGFEPEIKKIIANLPKERQTMMFSATWPTEIRELAQKYLKNPVKVTIGSDDLTACNRVTQIVEVIDQRDKDRRLEALLTKYHKNENRILIFCLYKKEAARVERNLYGRGWNVCGIHGDMGQAQRTAAFNGFKDGSVPLLVATDVAARGLDIPDVEYVINYTFPLTIEDYIHRIGRTGRANKTGVAHTLFTILEKPKAGDLCRILKEANQTVPPELEKFGPSIAKKKEHGMYGTAYANVDGEKKTASRITFD